MKLKLLLVIVVIAVLGVALLTFRRGARSQEQPPEPYSLRWRAQQALANGQTELRQGINLNYAGVEDLNDALAGYSLLVVQPIARIYGENDGSVGSWYKVRILEQLTLRPPCTDCRPLNDAPSALGALAADEIAIPRATGTLYVDGVTITTEEVGFPEFLLTQKYLLFVTLDPAKKVATCSIGAVGSYLIDPSGLIIPVRAEGNHVASDLATSYGNSLNQLRAALGVPTPTPTPGSCNSPPIVVQHCENNGGSWDYESCLCY